MLVGHSVHGHGLFLGSVADHLVGWAQLSASSAYVSNAAFECNWHELLYRYGESVDRARLVLAVCSSIIVRGSADGLRQLFPSAEIWCNGSGLDHPFCLRVFHRREWDVRSVGGVEMAKDKQGGTDLVSDVGASA